MAHLLDDLFSTRLSSESGRNASDLVGSGSSEWAGGRSDEFLVAARLSQLHRVGMVVYRRLGN